MDRQPTFETKRPILRPFTPTDGSEVQRLAGDIAIASTTMAIPHPYIDGMAEEWIATHPSRFKTGELVNFAIILRENDRLAGSIGLTVERDHHRAELGYWIGKSYWGRGYCSEAAGTVVSYGFEELGLNRVYAWYMKRNPASGRVLEKIGMTYEGCHRQHVRKWDSLEDVGMYGILQSDYVRMKRESSTDSDVEEREFSP